MKEDKEVYIFDTSALFTFIEDEEGADEETFKIPVLEGTLS